MNDRGIPSAEQQSRSTDDLMIALYDRLKRVANQQLRGERAGETWQPTVLVHEVYLRLSNAERAQWDSAGHFFVAAARTMRRILIDRARQKQSLKRGREWRRQSLADWEQNSAEFPPALLLDLHEALEGLAAREPDKAQVVELKFFGGLTLAEIAELLGVSASQVHRDWVFARAWLYSQLSPESA